MALLMDVIRSYTKGLAFVIRARASKICRPKSVKRQALGSKKELKAVEVKSENLEIFLAFII